MSPDVEDIGLSCFNTGFSVDPFFLAEVGEDQLSLELKLSDLSRDVFFFFFTGLSF